MAIVEITSRALLRSAGNHPDAIDVGCLIRSTSCYQNRRRWEHLSEVHSDATVQPPNLCHLLKLSMSSPSVQRIPMGLTPTTRDNRTDLLPDTLYSAPAARHRRMDSTARSNRRHFSLADGSYIGLPCPDAHTVYQTDRGLLRQATRLHGTALRQGICLRLSIPVAPVMRPPSPRVAQQKSTTCLTPCTRRSRTHSARVDFDVLIKALLVHGAKQDDDAYKAITSR